MASGKMRFTDSARGIDGFAAEWFFLVHKAFPELCSKRTKSEARKIAGFVHLMRG